MVRFKRGSLNPFIEIKTIFDLLIAFRKFSEIKELDFTEVKEAYFMPFGDNAGASPDGLVGEGENLEIKCPRPNKFFKLVSKGIPWPLGSFDNKRSFCSIDNLMFIIKELINREDIPSGVYNVADDEALSTNEVFSLLAVSQNRIPKIWFLPKGLIKALAKLGDLLRLPLTTERLQKLTESYVVSNQKIKSVIGKNLQISAKDGLLKTFNSFYTNVQ